MKAKSIAITLLTLLSISPALAGESCTQLANRVQRFLDANPAPPIDRLTPFLGDQEELMYCSLSNKLSEAVLPRLVAAVNAVEAREREKMNSNRNIAVVTDSNFQSLLSSAKMPVVLVGVSVWCRPCRSMIATLDELAAERRGRMQFAMLDVDAYPKLRTHLMISGLPTVIVFKNENAAERHEGVLDKTALAALIDGPPPPPRAATVVAPAAVLAERDPLVDIVVGSASAPVTVIEYGTAKNPETQAFAREFYARLKQRYIDTGKIRFEYREIPTGPEALAVAFLAKCIAKNDDQKYLHLLTDTDFTLESGRETIDALYTVGAKYGLDKESVNVCLGPATKAAIAAWNEFAEKVSKTITTSPHPQFFINGERVEETSAQVYSAVDAKILAALRK